MAFCERLSEQLAVVAVIDPQAGASVAITSNVVSMINHRRALFILSKGAGTAGVLVNIQEATAGFAAGTATILTRAAVNCAAPNTQYLFEVTSEALAAGNTALRAILTPVATDLLSLVCLADVVRYHPASDYDIASMTAIQVAN